MPPAARGPVFTVRRPIFTGLFWAIAGNGRVAATAVAPARNERRLMRHTDMEASLMGRLERGRLLGHPSPNRHVAELVPDAIHFGQDGGVRLADVDGAPRRHPARPAGDPEHFRAAALGVEEVATDADGVIDDALDAIALGHQAAVQDAQVVEARSP